MCLFEGIVEREGLIKRRGHATRTILRFSKHHNYVILLLFLDILRGLGHHWILFIVYPASDMKYAEYIV